jgi:hypothetical protein
LIVAKALGMGSDRNFAAARSDAPAGTAEGFLGSDPNSGQGLRAGQERLTDLGSDPNNPDPINPFTASVVASNCVVGIESFLSVFILAPLSPPALSRPAGRERELTATFGRVFKAKKYPFEKHVEELKMRFICLNAQWRVY